MMYDVKFVYFIWLSLYTLVHAVIVPQDPTCHQPFGLENGNILDGEITVPPEAVYKGKEGKYARLNNNNAWCIPSDTGSKSDTYYEKMYITVDLTTQHYIKALALQGYDKYSYGRQIRISYKRSGDFLWYKVNNDFMIDVLNKKGDGIEYLVFQTGIYTKEIRVHLLYGSNTKCLRLEIYGCGSEWTEREYQECKNKDMGIISNLPDSSFNETDFYHHDRIPYKALSLQFTLPFSWCIKTTAISYINPYKHYATVDLSGDYILYGALVNGLRSNVNDYSEKYLSKTFKLQYSLDNKKWAYYNGGMTLQSLSYTKSKLKIDPPLVAKYVRIRMYVHDRNLTCIKLQLYGCKAVLASDVTTLPPNVTTNVTTATTPIIPARILYYDLYQGHQYNSKMFWIDSKYTRTMTATNYLTRGTGCLINGDAALDPFKFPACWIGWNKKYQTQPFIFITLTRPTVVNAIKLTLYVNTSAGVSTIRRIYVSSEVKFAFQYLDQGETCSPESAYSKESRIIVLVIDLNHLRLQHLKLLFDYSGDWILIRKMELIQGTVPSGALKLSKTSLSCPIPVNSGGAVGEGSSSPKIVIIVSVVFPLLFLLLLVFVIYRYRTSLHKVILKSRLGKKSIVVRTAYDSHRLLGDDRSSVRTTPGGSLGTHYTENVNSTEDVYASPNANISLSSDNDLSEKPAYAGVQYLQYSHIDSDNSSGTANSTLYAKPTLKQQYAEPNTLTLTPIYQGSAIYASTYVSPYQAVVSSSLYSDPALLCNQKSQSFKIFPRSQLTFKEKIGDGQFSEVHIAEARGLDEIYGTIGHYNSWGLADTALVAVKLLQSVDNGIETEFMKEVNIMSRLKHENVVRLLGVCNDHPKLMVVEYMENGDLNQFLRHRKSSDTTQNIRISQIPDDVLLLDTLYHMAQQITAGLKYLHSEGFVHRDLATRNCLVGQAYQVKISDFGMSRYLYSKHYYRIEGKAVLPIRWMAPESLYYGTFTPNTDVWSFGVTLWEIFTFARESPYERLSDPQVIENACEMIGNPKDQFMYLEQPENCPHDIYDLMIRCWQQRPEGRPTFAFLYHFFKEISDSQEVNI